MKILLVDDDAQILRGLARMIECEIDDWEVETALSGEEALGLLDSTPFNVVVSDMRMPGMDGDELLQLIEDRHPNVFRIVLSGQADRATVLNAVHPMHQYLSKPCDLGVLITLVKRAEILQNTISSSDVLDAIGKANCLPVLPSIVGEIVAAFDDDDWNVHSVVHIVEKDPLLSARILQIANSAIFALPHPVLDLQKGVSILGAEMIKSLAMSKIFSQKDVQRSSAISTDELFSHSLEVAIIARELSRQFHPSDDEADFVFSGALLHDIGKLILIDAFPDRYATLIRQGESDDHQLWQLELAELGASHQGVGAYLLELWGVPAPLIEMVASHHSFDVCSRRTTACQLVYGANWICNGGNAQLLESEVKSAQNPELAERFADDLVKWKNAQYQLAER